MIGKGFGRRKRVRKVFLDKSTAHQSERLSSSLEENKTKLLAIFDSCADAVFRPFDIGGQRHAFLLYIDGLIDNAQLDESLLKPLMSGTASEMPHDDSELLPFLQNRLIMISQVKRTAEWDRIEREILHGSVVICVDNQAEALVVGLAGGNTRSVDEPASESTVRGSRDSFTEILSTNTSLIRRRVRSSRLKIELLTVGEITRTDVAIAYLKGITNESTLREIKSRIQAIEIDVVLESGYIEQLIEEKTYSPFPQFLVTERPDYLAAALLQGQVAIFTDGSPFAISAPMTFWGFMQAGEDYYERVLYINSIRVIRFIFAMIALLLPSLYVALTTFHQQMIPTNLLLSIAAAREGVPFPALVEAMLMEVTFEGLREAGVRLPKQVGQAVSIVGGLVVGQAAVQAGIVSAPMVIVVSLTGIASFTIPRYNFSIAFRLLRFPLIILAGMFGLYGVSIGLVVILVHLSGLKSFGVPYLFPVAPVTWQGLKDALFRAPLWTLYLHPQTGGKKLRRKGSG
ncbi:spore germination protein [Paenibacillus glycinis]|uniref:Spore germination protein n=1 Tax=Paenibacillus glycinis TaxID=2697035 RepID=A0ABW9Y0M3_9BACL|nr:spore germination protein [Paenibacillus glycinis]